jgi:hypothetical protein
VRLAVTLALLAVCAPAGAAKNRPRALVIVDWRGGWEAEEKQQVLDALAQGLDGAGLDRVDDQISGFTVDSRFKACLEREACRFEYARATGAAYVFAAILVRQGPSARVAMTLYDVPLLSESVVGVKKGKSGVASACHGARKLIAELMERERKLPRGTLDLASAPPGDAVFIDGHAAGVTNLSQVLYVGPHVVRIERQGLPPHIAMVNVVADKPLRYQARFEKGAVPSMK